MRLPKRRKGKIITVKIRFSDFKTLAHVRTLDHATCVIEEISKAVFECPGRVELKGKKVRLIGARSGNLENAEG